MLSERLAWARVDMYTSNLFHFQIKTLARHAPAAYTHRDIHIYTEHEIRIEKSAQTHVSTRQNLF